MADSHVKWAGGQGCSPEILIGGNLKMLNCGEPREGTDVGVTKGGFEL